MALEILVVNKSRLKKEEDIRAWISLPTTAKELERFIKEDIRVDDEHETYGINAVKTDMEHLRDCIMDNGNESLGIINEIAKEISSLSSEKRDKLIPLLKGKTPQDILILLDDLENY